MTTTIRGISSMATRQLLAELGAEYATRSGTAVEFESVGGVDAAKRVEAGEAFDVVVLADDAIDKLIATGKVLAGSKVDLVRSGVAVAVKAGSPRPDISSEQALKDAVMNASTVGYSTGPSGTALMKLFERWGVLDQLQGRLVQATPGVPVGSMVADGRVALGFQQLSELIHLGGIEIVGNMPAGVQIVTTFAGGVCAASAQAHTVRDLLAFIASQDAAPSRQRQGMDAP
jgi:molybdate transport system substrate-binding protein